jgi:serine/threonine protein kinase
MVNRLTKLKLTIVQAFARKLLHIPWLTRGVVEKEVEAIRKICGQGRPTNIVAVLKHGELQDGLLYFIDMELCALNLSEYIYRQNPVAASESMPYFIKNAPPPLKSQQIWNIMRQIASGLTYIHDVRLGHRDLKPANGTFPFLYQLTGQFSIR